MAGRLQRELKQTKPFTSLELEAFLNLVRTADQLGRELSAMLKPYNLTPAQYNVLRILRGAGPDGLPCGEIGARMVTWDPDITRLLDRVERRGLVTRARAQDDRRVVLARITAAGSQLLNKPDLDTRLNDVHRRNLGHLGREELSRLIDALESVRERLEKADRP
jgi:DNA-binding MarR family transcriptional regulator